MQKNLLQNFCYAKIFGCLLNTYYLHYISKITNNYMDGQSRYISLYPNPVTTNKRKLQLENIDEGVYDVFVYNAKGQHF